MTQETIVAAFDTTEQAQAAARAVEAAGIPASDITQHAGDTPGASTAPLASDVTPPHKEGFWAKLFGADDDHYAHDTTTTRDHAVYDRTITGGGAVLSIRLASMERDADRVLDILDAHNPIDIEERASSYGDTATAAPVTGTGIGAGIGNEVIQLAEEALVVGKRVVSSGTTRIRRYVVETPVSEDVSLHQETVSVERRPVTGTAPLAADAFTDKTFEVTEMNEEAVVGKTARVVEEVLVHKDATDRVETIRDTVRREELEVEKHAGATDTLTTAKPL